MSLSQLKDYLRTTSPLSKLQNSNKIPLKQIHNSIDAKLSLMKDKPKNYQGSLNRLKRTKRLSSSNKRQTDEFSQIKASSIIYNIPELSPPQINFQISNQLRHRINEIKSEIVTKLPAIKSSQFSSNKVQSFFSRRIVLKDLQTWLQEKLKDPPLTYEDSIQYKNMIMGIGMKEVIRLIGTRCNQQATIVNQIWELTWSICRQIILHLSKRAHKCEKILLEQTSFFRQGCELKMKTTQNQIKQLKQQNQQLKQRNEKLSSDILNLRKKNKQIKLTKIKIESQFSELKEQFESIFKQNILLHLKMSPNDHSKRQCLKRKFRLYLDDKKKNKSLFKEFLENFMNQNNISIEEQELDQRQIALQINKYKHLQGKRNLQIQQQLYQKFKSTDKQTQTPIIQKQSKIIQTLKIQTNQKSIQTQIINKQQYGMVTEIFIQDVKKLKGKKEKTIKKPGQQKKKEKEKKQNKSKFKHKISLNQEAFIKQNIQQSEQEKQIQQTQMIIQDKFQDCQQNIKKKTLKEVIIEGNQNKKPQDIKGFIYQNNFKEDANQQSLVQNIAEQKNTINQQLRYLHQKQCKKEQILQSQKLRINQIIIQEFRPQKNQKQIKFQNQICQSQKILKENHPQVKIDYKYQNSQPFSQKHIQPCILQHGQCQISQQTQYLIDLIKNKDYEQVIKILLDKNPNKQVDSFKKYPKIVSQQSDNQGSINMHQEIMAPKNLKSFKKMGVYNQIGYPHRTNKYLQNQDLIEQQQEQLQFFSKKGSKRVSQSKKSIINQLKMLRNQLEQQNQQQNIVIKMQVVNFVEACTKYLYEISPLQLQNNNSNKQGGLNEYSKKLLREQFKQIHKQVIEGYHSEKSQKQMRTVVDKGLNFILKQLCKQFQLAQKQGLQRIQQIKINYSSLPILMTNRFNINFGVKKVASKHIKDFLICLKGIKKYTEKYQIIGHFMLNAASLTNNKYIFQYQEAELLFFFVLLINIMDGMNSQHVITKNEAQSIAQLTKKYLTRDQNLIQYVKGLPDALQYQNCNNFVNFYKRFMKKYEQVSRHRIQQNQFIYQVLHRRFKDGKQGIKWVDFINFISVFNVKREQNDYQSNWHSSIVNTMIQTILQEKNSQNRLITHECFMKFVVKCPQFSLKTMQIYIQSVSQDSEINFESNQSKQKIEKVSNQLINHIIKNINKNENLTQSQINFWIKYSFIHILQYQVDNVLGSLLSGVLDPRTKQVIVGQQREYQKLQ